jgi:hypothetical protein
MAFGIFEAAVGSEIEIGMAKQASLNSMNEAIYDVRDKLGPILFASSNVEEFRHKVAMMKNDQSVYKIIEASGLFPSTSVVRRIVGKNGVLEDEFKRHLADNGATMPPPAPMPNVPQPSGDYAPAEPGTTASRTACYPGCDKNEAHAKKFHKDKADKEARRTGVYDTINHPKWDNGVQDINDTFEGGKTDKELKPKGDFKGYLNKVDQDAPSKVKRNFASREAAAVYVDWCKANNLSPVRLSSLDRYAENLPTDEFFRLANTIAAWENEHHPDVPDTKLKKNDKVAQRDPMPGYVAWCKRNEYKRLSARNINIYAKGDPQLAYFLAMRAKEAIKVARRRHGYGSPEGTSDDFHSPSPGSPQADYKHPGQARGWKGTFANDPQGPYDGELYTKGKASVRGGPGPDQAKYWTTTPHGMSGPHPTHDHAFDAAEPFLQQDAEIGRGQGTLFNARRRRHGAQPGVPDVSIHPHPEGAILHFQAPSDDSGLDSFSSFSHVHPSVESAHAHATERLKGYGLDSSHIKVHARRRRHGAQDYLQKADDALTQLLNQKAEEFKEIIAPLQQALVTVQQAAQLQQQQSPLSVLPTPGTVNVLPGAPDSMAGQTGMPDPNQPDISGAVNALANPLGGGGQQPPPDGGQGAPPPAAAAAGGLPPDPNAQRAARARGKARGAVRPRQAAGVGELWDNWRNQKSQGGDALRGGDVDYDQFKNETGVGDRAMNKLKQRNENPDWAPVNGAAAAPKGPGAGTTVGRRHRADMMGQEDTGQPNQDMVNYHDPDLGHVMQGRKGQRKQAWSGWGPSVAPKTRKVAGWDWDNHLNGYLANRPQHFACECGDSFPAPSGFQRCACGRQWNSYVIGSDGPGREASADKFIVREVPVRPDVIVANRRMVAKKRANQQLLTGNYEDMPDDSPKPIVGKPADADYHLDRGNSNAAWTLHKEKQHGKPLSQFNDDDWAIAGDPPSRQGLRLVDPRTGKLHNLVDPGECEGGKDAGHPTFREQPKDWAKRSKGGQWQPKAVGA